MALVPDFEEQGIDDLETILVPLAHHLRPMLLNSWKERSKVAFTKNAKKMKCLLDNLQQRLDKPFLNMQLYEKALNLFEDDQSTLHQQDWDFIVLQLVMLVMKCMCHFLLDVVHDEGIGMVGMSDLNDNVDSSSAA
ncbi:unnamed protein product [Ilex paraguariensis]|uniref:E3 UFM1-protein ligase 1-like domain-containing protein n=1 Tax=Ilex paraguariensis TaxID=185542 RepID=A0ABC8RGG9_9AQUA